MGTTITLNRRNFGEESQTPLSSTLYMISDELTLMHKHNENGIVTTISRSDNAVRAKAARPGASGSAEKEARMINGMLE